MDHEWGMLIAIYLFLGGLSAGLLALSAVATLVDRQRFGGIALVGAWAAPWPVLAGTGLLVLDLGQPFYFWKLLTAIEPQSPMWLGTWLLTLFSIVGLPYAALFLPPRRRVWAPRHPAVWRRRLAWIGLPLGCGVGIYTGVLLGVLVARPLWNTPLLAQLFLVSAVSTAAALLMLLARRWTSNEERRLLALGDATLIAVELVVIAWIFADAWTSTASARAAVALLSRGVYGWVFWLGVVALGLLLPLVLEAVHMSSSDRGSRLQHGALIPMLASVLVLAGGFMLRWVIVSAGQASGLS
jgi:formate-dependent nitrite reductase membrane component NrfD